MVLKYNPLLSIGLDLNDGNVGPAGPPGLGVANAVFVDSIDDLPAPVGNVITLAVDKGYILTGILDLTGYRLVIPAGGVFRGFDRAGGQLLSTGLAPTSPLITVQGTVNLSDLTLTHDYCLSAVGPLPSVNTVINCTNVIFNGDTYFKDWTIVDLFRCGFVEGKADFDGTIGSVVFDTCAVFNTTNVVQALDFLPTLTITRRVRLFGSIFTITPGNSGVAVHTATSIPDEQFILDRCNFQGGGTYLVTIDQNTDVRFRASDCTGVLNTIIGGKLYMVDNTLPTDFTSIGQWVKAAGVTTPDSDFLRNFIHTNDRLTSNTDEERRYYVDVNASLSCLSNNQDLEVAIFSSRAGQILNSSRINGNFSNLAGSRFFATSAVEPLDKGQFVEVWVRNNSSTASIVVDHLSIIVTEL